MCLCFTLSFLSCVFSFFFVCSSFFCHPPPPAPLSLPFHTSPGFRFKSPLLKEFPFFFHLEATSPPDPLPPLILVAHRTFGIGIRFPFFLTHTPLASYPPFFFLILSKFTTPPFFPLILDGSTPGSPRFICLAINGFLQESFDPQLPSLTPILPPVFPTM